MTEPATAPVPHQQISLSVGDRVVYPNQGLCTVTDIKTEEIAGQKLVFVSLQVVETGARVKAPREKLARIGIRRLSNADDVKRVFDFLKSDSEKASLDWKKRARDNTLRLSEGGLRGLAEVVKGLQVLSELRPLPPKERELYNDARHLVVTEIAAALGGAECDAEDALDIVLFPVGKERPKRSIEEFKELGGDDEGLGDDLLGLDGETVEEPEEAVEPGEGDEETAPAVAAPAKKAAKPVKEKAAPKKKKAVVKDEDEDETDSEGDDDDDDDADAPEKESDEDKDEGDDEEEAPVTAASKKKAAAAKSAPAAKAAKQVAARPAEAKKRGRPVKAKPAVAAVPAAPKKRRRPPKAK